MKKLFAPALLLLSLNIALAQEEIKTPKHEIGLRLHGLNNFDFMYKKHKRENKFMRYRFLTANILAGTANSSSVFASNVNFGAALGKEKRKEIAEKLQFVSGWELITNFFIANTFTDFAILDANIGPGFVLGFQYNVKPNFYLSLETIPSVLVGGRYISYLDDDNLGAYLSAGFSTTSTALSLMYRF